MIRKVLLAAVLAAALPLVAGSSSAAKCTPWNAKNPGSHHKVGNLDVVGGKGYGSGYHTAEYRSPPQPLGAYGDPKRRAAQGGYVQYKQGTTVITIYLFGPIDETNNKAFYDTVFGACISAGGGKFDTKPQCLPTSLLDKPGAGWQPCGGY